MVTGTHGRDMLKYLNPLTIRNKESICYANFQTGKQDPKRNPG